MDLSDLDISVPGNWYVVDVDPTTRREQVVKAVASRIASRPELASHEQELVEMLVGFGEDAEARTAMSCAGMWEPSPYGPIVGFLIVLLVEPHGVGDAAAEVEALAETLAVAGATDVGPRELTTFDLPAGPAVRLRFLQEADEEGVPEVIFDVTQFWIPLPGRKPDPVTLMVSASTPSLHAGDLVADAAKRTAESLVVSG